MAAPHNSPGPWLLKLGSSDLEASTADPTRCVNECDPTHFKISAAIITLGVFAMLENILLLFVVATMKLGIKSKLLTFLWNFSLADTIIAFSFVFYHARAISVCPSIYTCDAEYAAELFALQAIFIFSLLASYFFVSAATVDTLLAVQWSLRYANLVTTRRVRVVSGLIWVVSITISVVGVALMIGWDRKTGHSVLTYVVASLCILTAAAVIVTNIIIIASAWISVNRGSHGYTEHKISRSEFISDISRKFSSCKRTSSASSFQFKERRSQNRKLVKTMVMFVAAFLVSCLPWPMTLLVCEDSRSCAIKSSSEYFLVMVLVHTIIIPIIYGFRIDEVNKRLRTIVENISNCRRKC